MVKFAIWDRRPYNTLTTMRMLDRSWIIEEVPVCPTVHVFDCYEV